MRIMESIILQFSHRLTSLDIVSRIFQGSEYAQNGWYDLAVGSPSHITTCHFNAFLTVPEMRETSSPLSFPNTHSTLHSPFPLVPHLSLIYTIRTS